MADLQVCQQREVHTSLCLCVPYISISYYQSPFKHLYFHFHVTSRHCKQYKHFFKKAPKKKHTTFPFLFKVKFFRDKSGLNYYVKLCHKFGDVLYEMMM